MKEHVTKSQGGSQDILDILHPFQHPINPNLFDSHEGYVPLDYFTRVCSAVECRYSLWVGTRKKGHYVPARPVVYHSVTRIQAFTLLVYALNTCQQEVNYWGQACSAITTREIEGEGQIE